MDILFEVIDQCSVVYELEFTSTLIFQASTVLLVSL